MWSHSPGTNFPGTAEGSLGCFPATKKIKQMRAQTCLIGFTSNIGDKYTFKSLLYMATPFLSLMQPHSGTRQLSCLFLGCFLTVLVNSLEFSQLMWECLSRFLRSGNSRHKPAEITTHSFVNEKVTFLLRKRGKEG